MRCAQYIKIQIPACIVSKETPALFEISFFLLKGKLVSASYIKVWKKYEYQNFLQSRYDWNTTLNDGKVYQNQLPNALLRRIGDISFCKNCIVLKLLYYFLYKKIICFKYFWVLNISNQVIKNFRTIERLGEKNHIWGRHLKWSYHNSLIGQHIILSFGEVCSPSSENFCTNPFEILMGNGVQ